MPNDAFRVGIAGWAIPSSMRRLRPSSLSQLQYYAAFFNAVEINSCFYRSHREHTYERWRQDTPSDFAFSVKMPRSITHDGGLQGCETEARQFLREVAGLGEKLKIILVQLPASLEFEARVAKRFFAMVAALEPNGRVVCEPRHESWLHDSAQNLLRRYGIGRVAADPARVAAAAVPGGDPTVLYYRLHGSPRMFYSAYDATFLQSIAQQMVPLAAQARESWCIFDNTASEEAWPNAREFQTLLPAQSATAPRGTNPPPDLVRS